jgi:hypothetical protein
VTVGKADLLDEDNRQFKAVVIQKAITTVSRPA